MLVLMLVLDEAEAGAMNVRPEIVFLVSIVVVFLFAIAIVVLGTYLIQNQDFDKHFGSNFQKQIL